MYNHIRPSGKGRGMLSSLLYELCIKYMQHQRVGFLIGLKFCIDECVHSYGLGGESLREAFTICIMHRSLLAV